MVFACLHVIKPGNVFFPRDVDWCKLQVVVLKHSGSSSRKKSRFTPKGIGGFSITLSFGASKDGVSIAKATTLLAPVHRPQWVNGDGAADFGTSHASWWSQLLMAL